MTEVVVAGWTSAARRHGLSRESFDALLLVLGPDRDRSGQRYEAIRARLLRFFLWRGSTAPEELTDETFDRVCRKITGGEVIRPAEAERYFLGVARNILREAWDRNRRRDVSQEVNEQALLRAASPPAASPASDDNPVLACLEGCLRALPPETRDLVLLYYEYDGGEQIEQRKALAARVGIGANALRIRLHRLRARLEDCVRACMKEKK